MTAHDPPAAHSPPAPSALLVDGTDSAAPAEEQTIMHSLLERLESATQRLSGGLADWTSDLPTVVLRAEYQNCPAPQSLTENGTKACWPIKSFREYRDGINAEDVLADFRSHLVSDKAYEQATVADHILAMQRVLHMLEVNGKAVVDRTMACDPKLIVAMYVETMQKKLLALPVLGPQYSWSRKLVEGLVAFAEWHRQTMRKKVLADGSGQWFTYTKALDQLITELTQGGQWKRISENKSKRREAKKVEDLAKIKALPSRTQTMHGIRRAQLQLMHIARASHGATDLSEAMQSDANACLVGIIFCDGFAGRCQEWELMLRETVDEALSSGQDWLLCSTHKMSRTYGDLAKWIAPGVVQALKCYLSLPRRPTCSTLLVPCRATTEHVHVPNALWKFACDHLPSGDYSKPTVNLLRKYFHTILMDLSRSEEKLLELMKVIDAHSVSVARKHYVLRDPAKDANLAKQLVKVALKETVPWPSAGELEACYSGGEGQLSLPSGGFSYSGNMDASELPAEDRHSCVIWHPDLYSFFLCFCVFSL